MRELSVVEQRYQAVLAVISDGETVTDVAARFGVRRQTVHEWLAKYEGGGLDALVDRSHRPRSCPHQMGSAAEVAVLELRRAHPSWGPRRLRFELVKRELGPVPSESAIYRCLVRHGQIAPDGRRARAEHWRRWERGRPNERPRNGWGTAALVLAVVALLIGFVPIIGDVVALGGSVAAMGCGARGLFLVEDGLATNPGTAWAGILLGFVAGLLSLLTLVSVIAA
jgi:transposase